MDSRNQTKPNYIEHFVGLKLRGCICSVWLERSESEWGKPLVGHLQACGCIIPWSATWNSRCCIVWMPARGPHARRSIFCWVMPPSPKKKPPACPPSPEQMTILLSTPLPCSEGSQVRTWTCASGAKGLGWPSGTPGAASTHLPEYTSWGNCKVLLLKPRTTSALSAQSLLGWWVYFDTTGLPDNCDPPSVRDCKDSISNQVLWYHS